MPSQEGLTQMRLSGLECREHFGYTREKESIYTQCSPEWL